MINPDTLRTFLTSNLDNYIALLEQMVNINSYTGNRDGVNQLGRMTADLFADLGFAAEFVPSVHADYGDHLVLTRPGTGDHTIGCVSHLDTVFPVADEIANDFHWRVDGDKLYGPGTNDIKGGTIAMYMMLDALRTHAPAQFEATTWVLLLDASEERDGRDFGALCRARLDGALAGLIFEMGYLDEEVAWLLVKRKGMAAFKITVDGKASHAGSMHHLGANAIVQLADVIQKVTAFTDYERDLTFNVGMISGGTVTNRVPHEATALVEMRAYELDVYDDGVRQMLALNQYSSVRSQDGYPCTVTVEQVGKTRPWPRNAASDNLCKIWQAVGEKLDYTIIPTWRGGLSDGNHFWDAVPTMDALGPYGANAHCSERSADGSKDQEFVYRSSFVPKTVLNTLAVLELIAVNA